MKTVEGDLLQMAERAHFDVIAHGCNCFNSMSGGIALSIARKYPQAEIADSTTESGQLNKLGTVTLTKAKDYLDNPFVIANLYTQFNPGRNLDYTALRMCLRKLAAATPKGDRVGLPMIGCGIAGGNPVVVLTMIAEELEGHDVTIVKYVKN